MVKTGAFLFAKIQKVIGLYLKLKKTLSDIPWVLYNESNYKLHHRRIFE